MQKKCGQWEIPIRNHHDLATGKIHSQMLKGVCKGLRRISKYAQASSLSCKRILITQGAQVTFPWRNPPGSSLKPARWTSTTASTMCYEQHINLTSCPASDAKPLHTSSEMTKTVPHPAKTLGPYFSKVSKSRPIRRLKITLEKSKEARQTNAIWDTRQKPGTEKIKMQ